MHVGLAIFPTDYSIRAVPLARALEERGFESLFVVEHTHIPASRRTPYPMGGDLPSMYWESYELKLLDQQVELVAWARDLG